GLLAGPRMEAVGQPHEQSLGGRTAAVPRQRRVAAQRRDTGRPPPSRGDPKGPARGRLPPAAELTSHSPGEAHPSRKRQRRSSVCPSLTLPARQETLYRGLQSIKITAEFLTHLPPHPPVRKAVRKKMFRGARTPWCRRLASSSFKDL